MRIAFAPPTEGEFIQLFNGPSLKKGGGIDDITVFQPYTPTLSGRRRGGGFFSFISGIAKRVLPVIFKAAKPVAKEFGASVAQDLINGDVPLKQSLKKHGIKALKRTGVRLIKGSGKRPLKTNVKKTRKKDSIFQNVLKKKKGKRGYKRDIFSLI